VLPEPATSPFTPAEEAQLFDACLVHGLSREHLAAAINDPHLSSLDILAWFDNPQTQQTLAAFRRAQARFAAITTLEHICTHHPDLTNRRLAATKLLNPTSPKRKRGSFSPSHSEDAEGWVRATSSFRPDHSQTDLDGSPEPLPDANEVGVGSSDLRHQQPGGHTPSPTPPPQPTQSVIVHPAFKPHDIAADHPPINAAQPEYPSTQPHTHTNYSATTTLTRQVEPRTSTHLAGDQINSSDDG
jgi:hypothetical protein